MGRPSAAVRRDMPPRVFRDRLEAVQVCVVPVEGDLQHAVQPAERHVRRHFEPPPDRGSDATQADPEAEHRLTGQVLGTVEVRDAERLGTARGEDVGRRRPRDPREVAQVVGPDLRQLDVGHDVVDLVRVDRARRTLHGLAQGLSRLGEVDVGDLRPGLTGQAVDHPLPQPGVPAFGDPGVLQPAAELVVDVDRQRVVAAARPRRRQSSGPEAVTTAGSPMNRSTLATRPCG